VTNYVSTQQQQLPHEKERKKEGKEEIHPYRKTRQEQRLKLFSFPQTKGQEEWNAKERRPHRKGKIKMTRILRKKEEFFSKIVCKKVK
jgi:hypothetical protein